MDSSLQDPIVSNDIVKAIMGENATQFYRTGSDIQSIQNAQNVQKIDVITGTGTGTDSDNPINAIIMEFRQNYIRLLKSSFKLNCNVGVSVCNNGSIVGNGNSNITFN